VLLPVVCLLYGVRQKLQPQSVGESGCESALFLSALSWACSEIVRSRGGGVAFDSEAGIARR
jgi:hypothetical protein